jgi:hypothetical protein
VKNSFSAGWVGGFDIFCSGLAHLPSGAIFTAGGNLDNTGSTPVYATYTFNNLTNIWNARARHDIPALVSDGDGFDQRGDAEHRRRPLDCRGAGNERTYFIAQPSHRNTESAALPSDERRPRRPRLLLRS